MRKSAIFILIFTAIVLAGFYSYNNITVKPAAVVTSTKAVSPTAVVTVAPPSTNGKMTMNDVFNHNKRNDCYLVVKNNVYDVSSYISNHPGGQGKIISNCGQEVTGIFADIHSNFAWDLLKNYQIGQI